MTKLTYSTVRNVATEINRQITDRVDGAPVTASRTWVEGALVLENAGYGAWSVCKVTSRRGTLKRLHEGKLRECYSFLCGMRDGMGAVA